jgi:gamma-glutamyltranspeptidase / glutathione hydrolase
MPVVATALSPNLSLQRRVTKPSVRSKSGIVVSQNRVASAIGARVLKEGGHAADAAVATALALGVVEPWMSGIGGVGAALVFEAKTGKVTALDFGGRSPAALDPADFPLTRGEDADLFGWPMVKDSRNTVGAKAVVVPSEPAGLGLLHRTFGRKCWRDLVAPAVRLADDGPVVDWYTTLMIATEMGDLVKDPGARARFLPGGVPPQAPAATAAHPVMRLPMPDLARTLKALADDGPGALYKGALARAIAGDVQAMGGYLSEADLASYEAQAVVPLEIHFGRHTICVLPELNGGPTLAVAFKDLVTRRTKPGPEPDGATFAAYAAALQTAWADRLRRMGDAGERTAPTSTTHFAVVDRDGNVVTLTQTLLSQFGARIVLPSTGILMNNGINWFDPRPGGPNALRANARVLANYSPAIMTGADTVIGIGGCGGRKILPAVFQLLAMIAEFGFDLDRAFHSPRIDVSGGARVAADRRMPAETIAALATAFDIVLAEPVVCSHPFTIASAARRSAGLNEGATEPEQPWAEAVAEEQV